MKTLSAQYVALLAMVLLLVSCFTPKDKPRPVARVYDKYLYSTDIENLFLRGVSKEDSMLITNSYIEKWVQTQLMLRMAEHNLSDAQKNVARQLEDYRTSLLIFKYEQEYVNQKMDTTVKPEELEVYYNQHKDNFVLDEMVVKALYIKLRKEAPQVQKIKELYRSTREDDVRQLDNLAYQASTKYDYFGDKWVSLPFILRELPYPLQNAEELLNRQRYIEMEDGDFIYLVNFRDVLAKGGIAPFEYVAESIKQIALNSRKQKLIVDLQQKIYTREQDKNNFQIFKQ